MAYKVESWEPENGPRGRWLRLASSLGKGGGCWASNEVLVSSALWVTSLQRLRIQPVGNASTYTKSNDRANSPSSGRLERAWGAARSRPWLDLDCKPALGKRCALASSDKTELALATCEAVRSLFRPSLSVYITLRGQIVDLSECFNYAHTPYRKAVNDDVTSGPRVACNPCNDPANVFQWRPLFGRPNERRTFAAGKYVVLSEQSGYISRQV
jgi:hypothetical protein